MSDDDKLDGFKISDMKQAKVHSFHKTVPAQASQDTAGPTQGSGFENIERRLEAGSIEELADEIRETYQKLEDMSGSGDMKTKSAAQKAMGAYERTADLFEYLFATKQTLQE
jgi:hypothetical protein